MKVPTSVAKTKSLFQVIRPFHRILSPAFLVLFLGVSFTGGRAGGGQRQLGFIFISFSFFILSFIQPFIQKHLLIIHHLPSMVIDTGATKKKRIIGPNVHYLVGKAKVNESINHFNCKTGVLYSETIFRIELF